MKKHYCKRKKVVVDILDGKIINEPTPAIKIENIEEYVEKNGYKLLKKLMIFTIIILMSQNTFAYDASYMTKLDLSILPNVYLLISIIFFAVVLIIFSLKNNIFTLLILGSIILLFIGLILLANGFNITISILICLISIILIWLGY